MRASSFTRFIGLEVEELREGYCRTRLLSRTPAGLCGRMSVVSAEYANLLRPGFCDALVTEVKAGRRLITGEADVFGEKDGERVAGEVDFCGD